MTIDPVLLSRAQFAFTLSFHILFPTLTIGLSAYILGWEIAWLRTKKTHYYCLCRFWIKVFALAFGIGVVSGIVLSYEFGTNFGKFSQIVGNVLGPLMSYEALAAFFLEAAFLGIMLFGWKRVSPKAHLFATAVVTISTFSSAFWILSANSWMHTPNGYTLDHGIFKVNDWWAAIFNPSFPYRLMHMTIGSYLTVSVLITGVSAWYLLQRRHQDTARLALMQALAASLILAPLQIFLGDLHGLNTLKYQPYKISAIEARWDTMHGAPLTLFAIPDVQNATNLYSVDIPKLGSIILRHDVNGEVKGLKDLPKEDRPYVPIPFFAFRIMVSIGMLMLITALWGQYLRLSKRLLTNEYFLRWCVLIAPIGFIAVIAGWFTTEAGRQPWTVYGLLRVQDSASSLSSISTLTSMAAFVILYGIIFIAFTIYLLRLIRKGPLIASPNNATHHLSGWLEHQL